MRLPLPHVILPLIGLLVLPQASKTQSTQSPLQKNQNLIPWDEVPQFYKNLIEEAENDLVSSPTSAVVYKPQGLTDFKVFERKPFDDDEDEKEKKRLSYSNDKRKLFNINRFLPFALTTKLNQWRNNGTRDDKDEEDREAKDLKKALRHENSFNLDFFATTQAPRDDDDDEVLHYRGQPAPNVLFSLLNKNPRLVSSLMKKLFNRPDKIKIPSMDIIDETTENILDASTEYLMFTETEQSIQSSGGDFSEDRENELTTMSDNNDGATKIPTSENIVKAFATKEESFPKTSELFSTEQNEDLNQSTEFFSIGAKAIVNNKDKSSFTVASSTTDSSSTLTTTPEDSPQIQEVESILKTVMEILNVLNKNEDSSNQSTTMPKSLSHDVNIVSNGDLDLRNDDANHLKDLYELSEKDLNKVLKFVETLIGSKRKRDEPGNMADNTKYDKTESPKGKMVEASTNIERIFDQSEEDEITDENERGKQKNMNAPWSKKNSDLVKLLNQLARQDKTQISDSDYKGAIINSKQSMNGLRTKDYKSQINSIKGTTEPSVLLSIPLKNFNEIFKMVNNIPSENKLRSDRNAPVHSPEYSDEVNCFGDNQIDNEANERCHEKFKFTRSSKGKRHNENNKNTFKEEKLESDHANPEIEKCSDHAQVDKIRDSVSSTSRSKGSTLVNVDSQSASTDMTLDNISTALEHPLSKNTLNQANETGFLDRSFTTETESTQTPNFLLGITNDAMIQSLKKCYKLSPIKIHNGLIETKKSKTDLLAKTKISTAMFSTPAGYLAKSSKAKLNDKKILTNKLNYLTSNIIVNSPTTNVSKSAISLYEASPTSNSNTKTNSLDSVKIINFKETAQAPALKSKVINGKSETNAIMTNAILTESSLTKNVSNISPSKTLQTLKVDKSMKSNTDKNDCLSAKEDYIILNKTKKKTYDNEVTTSRIISQPMNKGSKDIAPKKQSLFNKIICSLFRLSHDSISPLSQKDKYKTESSAKGKKVVCLNLNSTLADNRELMELHIPSTTPKIDYFDSKQFPIMALQKINDHTEKNDRTFLKYIPGAFSVTTAKSSKKSEKELMLKIPKEKDAILNLITSQPQTTKENVFVKSNEAKKPSEISITIPIEIPVIPLERNVTTQEPELQVNIAEPQGCAPTSSNIFSHHCQGNFPDANKTLMRGNSNYFILSSNKSPCTTKSDFKLVAGKLKDHKSISFPPSNLKSVTSIKNSTSEATQIESNAIIQQLNRNATNKNVVTEDAPTNITTQHLPETEVQSEISTASSSSLYYYTHFSTKETVNTAELTTEHYEPSTIPLGPISKQTFDFQTLNEKAEKMETSQNNDSKSRSLNLTTAKSGSTNKKNIMSSFKGLYRTGQSTTSSSFTSKNKAKLEVASTTIVSIKSSKFKNLRLFFSRNNTKTVGKEGVSPRDMAGIKLYIYDPPFEEAFSYTTRYQRTTEQPTTQTTITNWEKRFNEKLLPIPFLKLIDRTPVSNVGLVTGTKQKLDSFKTDSFAKAEVRDNKVTDSSLKLNVPLLANLQSMELSTRNVETQEPLQKVEIKIEKNYLDENKLNITWRPNESHLRELNTSQTSLQIITSSILEGDNLNEMFGNTAAIGEVEEVTVAATSPEKSTAVIASELEDKVKSDNSAAQYKISSDEHKPHHNAISTPPVYVVHNFIKEDQRTEANERNLLLKRKKILLPSVAIKKNYESTELYQTTEVNNEVQQSETESIEDDNENMDSSNFQKNNFFNNFINTLDEVIKPEDKHKINDSSTQSPIIDNVEENLIPTSLEEYLHNPYEGNTVASEIEEPIAKNNDTNNQKSADLMSTSYEVAAKECSTLDAINETTDLENNFFDALSLKADDNFTSTLLNNNLELFTELPTDSVSYITEENIYDTTHIPNDLSFTDESDLSPSSSKPDLETPSSPVQAPFHSFDRKYVLEKMKWSYPYYTKENDEVGSKRDDFFDPRSSMNTFKGKNFLYPSKFRTLLANRQLKEEHASNQESVKDFIEVNDNTNSYKELNHDEDLQSPLAKVREKRNPIVYSIMATTSKPNQLVVHRIMTTSKDGIKGTFSPGFFNLAEKMVDINETDKKEAELQAFMGMNVTRDKSPNYSSGDPNNKMKDNFQLLSNIGYIHTTSNYKPNLRLRFNNYEFSTPQAVFKLGNYLKDEKDPHQVFNIYILNKVKNNKPTELIQRSISKKNSFFDKMNIFKKFGRGKSDIETGSAKNLASSANITPNSVANMKKKSSTSPLLMPTIALRNNLGTATPSGSFYTSSTSTSNTKQPSKHIKTSTSKSQKTKPSSKTNIKSFSSTLPDLPLETTEFTSKNSQLSSNYITPSSITEPFQLNTQINLGNETKPSQHSSVSLSASQSTKQEVLKTVSTNSYRNNNFNDNMNYQPSAVSHDNNAVEVTTVGSMDIILNNKSDFNDLKINMVEETSGINNYTYDYSTMYNRSDQINSPIITATVLPLANTSQNVYIYSSVCENSSQNVCTYSSFPDVSSSSEQINNSPAIPQDKTENHFHFTELPREFPENSYTPLSNFSDGKQCKVNVTNTATQYPLLHHITFDSLNQTINFSESQIQENNFNGSQLQDNCEEDKKATQYPSSLGYLSIDRTVPNETIDQKLSDRDKSTTEDYASSPSKRIETIYDGLNTESLANGVNSYNFTENMSYNSQDNDYNSFTTNEEEGNKYYTTSSNQMTAEMESNERVDSNFYDTNNNHVSSSSFHTTNSEETYNVNTATNLMVTDGESVQLNKEITDSFTTGNEINDLSSTEILDHGNTFVGSTLFSNPQPYESIPNSQILLEQGNPAKVALLNITPITEILIENRDLNEIPSTKIESISSMSLSKMKNQFNINSTLFEDLSNTFNELQDKNDSTLLMNRLVLNLEENKNKTTLMDSNIDNSLDRPFVDKNRSFNNKESFKAIFKGMPNPNINNSLGAIFANRKIDILKTNEKNETELSEINENTTEEKNSNINQSKHFDKTIEQSDSSTKLDTISESETNFSVVQNNLPTTYVRQSVLWNELTTAKASSLSKDITYNPAMTFYIVKNTVSINSSIPISSKEILGVTKPLVYSSTDKAQQLHGPAIQSNKINNKTNNASNKDSSRDIPSNKHVYNSSGVTTVKASFLHQASTEMGTPRIITINDQFNEPTEIVASTIKGEFLDSENKKQLTGIKDDAPKLQLTEDSSAKPTLNFQSKTTTSIDLQKVDDSAVIAYSTENKESLNGTVPKGKSVKQIGEPNTISRWNLFNPNETGTQNSDTEKNLENISSEDYSKIVTYLQANKVQALEKEAKWSLFGTRNPDDISTECTIEIESAPCSTSETSTLTDHTTCEISTKATTCNTKTTPNNAETTCPTEKTTIDTTCPEETTCTEETTCLTQSEKTTECLDEQSDATPYDPDEEELYIIKFKCSTPTITNKNFLNSTPQGKTEATKARKVFNSSQTEFSHYSYTQAYHSYNDKSKKPKSWTKKKDKICPTSTVSFVAPVFTEDEIQSSENEFWRTLNTQTYACTKKAIFNTENIKLNENNFIENLDKTSEQIIENLKNVKDKESKIDSSLIVPNEEMLLLMTADDSSCFTESSYVINEAENLSQSSNHQMNLQDQDYSLPTQVEGLAAMENSGVTLLPLMFNQNLNDSEEEPKIIFDRKQTESRYPEELESKIMSKTDTVLTDIDTSPTNPVYPDLTENEFLTETVSPEETNDFESPVTEGEDSYLNTEKANSAMDGDLSANIHLETPRDSSKNVRRSYINLENNIKPVQEEHILANNRGQSTAKKVIDEITTKKEDKLDYGDSKECNLDKIFKKKNDFETNNIVMNETAEVTESNSTIEDEIAKQIYLLSIDNKAKKLKQEENIRSSSLNLNAYINKDVNQIESESGINSQVIVLIDETNNNSNSKENERKNKTLPRETIFEKDKADKKDQLEDLRPNAYGPGKMTQSSSKLSTTHNIKETKGITLSPMTKTKSQIDENSYEEAINCSSENKSPSSPGFDKINSAEQKINYCNEGSTQSNSLITCQLEKLKEDNLTGENLVKSKTLGFLDKGFKIVNATNIALEKKDNSANKEMDLAIPDDRSEPEPDSLSNQIWDILTKAVRMQTFNPRNSRTGHNSNGDNVFHSSKSSNSIFVNENTISRFSGSSGKSRKEIFDQKNKGRKIFGYIQKEFNNSKISNGTDMNYYLSKLQIPTVDKSDEAIVADESLTTLRSIETLEDAEKQVSSTVKTIAEMLKIDPLLRYILDLGISRTQKPYNLSLMSAPTLETDIASQNFSPQIEKRASEENADSTNPPKSEHEHWNELLSQFSDSLPSEDYFSNDTSPSQEDSIKEQSRRKNRRDCLEVEPNESFSNQTSSLGIFNKGSSQPVITYNLKNPIQNSMENVEANNFKDLSPNSLFYMYGMSHPLNVYSMKKRQRPKNSVFAKDTGVDKKFNNNIYEFSKGTYRPIRMRSKRECDYNEFPKNDIERKLKFIKEDEDLGQYTTTITSVRRTGGMRKIQEVVNPWEGGRKGYATTPSERRKIAKILEAIESNNFEDTDDLIKCTDLSNGKKASGTKQRNCIKSEARNSSLQHKAKQGRRKMGYLLNNWGKNNKTVIYPYHEEVENPVKGKCINSRPNTLCYNISESFFDKGTNGTALLCHVDLKITTKNYTLAPDSKNNTTNKYSCYYNLPTVSHSGKPNVFVQYSPVYRSETNFSHAPQDYTTFLVKRVHKSLDQEYKYVVVNLNDIFYITVELNGDVYTYSDKSSPLRSRTVSKKLGCNKKNYKYYQITRNDKRRRKQNNSYLKTDAKKKTNAKVPAKKRVKLDLIISDQAQ